MKEKDTLTLERNKDKKFLNYILKYVHKIYIRLQKNNIHISRDMKM